MSIPAGYTLGASGFFYYEDGSGPYSIGSDGSVTLLGSGGGATGSPPIAMLGTPKTAITAITNIANVGGLFTWQAAQAVPDTWTDLINYTGAGIINVLILTLTGVASRTIDYEIIIDGVTVISRVGADAGATGGYPLVGAFPMATNVQIAPVTYGFGASLQVRFKSNQAVTLGQVILYGTVASIE